MTRNEELAKGHYGVTDSPTLAGFILTNGKMLDFSVDGIQRDYQHLDIGYFLREIHGADPGKSEDEDATHWFHEFLREGPIRVGDNMVNFHVTPTWDQSETLRYFIEYYSGEIYAVEGDMYAPTRARMFPAHSDVEEILEWIFDGNYV